MMSSNWRTVHFGLAVTSSAFAVTGLALAEMGHELNGMEYYNIHQLGLAIAFGWAGAVLMRYPKARPLARLLLICAAASGCALLAEGIAVYAMPTDPFANGLLAMVSTVGAFGSIAAAMAVLPQAFPAGPMPTRPWPAIFWTTATLSVLLPLGLVISGLLFGDGPESAAAFWLYIAFTFVGVGVGTMSLIVRWRRASASVRPQIRWYAIFNLLAPIGLIGSFASSFLTPILLSDLFIIVWPIAIVVVIAISVLSAQLYDIRVVIRRAVIYAVLALLVAVLFIAVYFVALYLISENFDRSEYRWIALAIAAAAVVLLEPVRQNLRDRLEQRLLGDRGDPLRALERLQRWISDDPNAAYTGTVEAVAAAVRSPQVIMRVQRDSTIVQVASTGVTDADTEIVPLIHSGERLGELEVSRRTPGEPFSNADTRLLQRMAHEAAAVVHAQRRDSELAGARRQAVDAVIDERSRLGRDLHDDLAPLLAGASLSLEGLRRGIPVGSPEEQEAARLATLLRHTATNTRRLAYDLQPPEFLGDFEGAVARYLKTLAGPELPKFRLTAKLQDVPHSLSHTAYRVVLEAINNVVQHARATQASVTVVTDIGALRLEVVDDGIGLEQPYVSGIGIGSMRRRIESVGGAFAISRVEPHGTRVTATIPVSLRT